MLRLGSVCMCLCVYAIKFYNRSTFHTWSIKATGFENRRLHNCFDDLARSFPNLQVKFHFAREGECEFLNVHHASHYICFLESSLNSTLACAQFKDAAT